MSRKFYFKKSLSFGFSSRNFLTIKRTHFVCISGLFIICNKQNTEEDFRDAFQKFGKIEEIYTIKDRNTGDNKG